MSTADEADLRLDNSRLLGRLEAALALAEVFAERHQQALATGTDYSLERADCWENAASELREVLNP